MNHITKKIIARMLSLSLICGAAFCGAAADEEASFEVNAELLEWIRVDHPSSVFVLQNDEIYTMQPDAQFASCSSSLYPIEEISGSTAMWSEYSFTDPEGAERKVWVLPINYYAVKYLKFAEGAFNDKEGNPSPEICAKYSYTAMSNFYGYSKPLSKLQTVKTDADFVEGDVVAYPQTSNSMPALYFSILIKTDAGVSSGELTYDGNHDLVYPAQAGDAEYTLTFCGQPIGETQSAKTISAEEYEELYEKDRELSVLKGLALAPCLPGYIVFYAIRVAGIYIAFSPSAAYVPVSMLIGPVMGVKEGFVSWWKTVSGLIGGKE